MICFPLYRPDWICEPSKTLSNCIGIQQDSSNEMRIPSIKN